MSDDFEELVEKYLKLPCIKCGRPLQEDEDKERAEQAAGFCAVFDGEGVEVTCYRPDCYVPHEFDPVHCDSCRFELENDYAPEAELKEWLKKHSWGEQVALVQVLWNTDDPEERDRLVKGLDMHLMRKGTPSNGRLEELYASLEKTEPGSEESKAISEQIIEVIKQHNKKRINPTT